MQQNGRAKVAWIEERKNSRGETTYTVVVRLKGFPSQTATFERKTDAKRWAQQEEAAIREGRHFKAVEARKRTFSTLVEQYNAELERRRGDAAKVNKHLEWWAKHLGPYLLSDITPIRINEARLKLESEITRGNKRRSPATVNRYLSSLSICFSYAVKDLGWVDDNPLAKVRKRTEPRGRMRFLDDTERELLLEAAKSDVANEMIYPMIVIALGTGMRWGEILNLKWREIDLKQRRIILEKTKNGERRTVPLAKPVLEQISNMSKVRHIHHEYVFTQHREGRKYFTPRKAWERVVKAAGINNFRFHDLRHTAASYLAMEGASTLEIAEILGHKTLHMVKRYSHFAEQHTMPILEKMNERQFGAAATFNRKS